MSARDEVAKALGRAQAYYPELLDRYEAEIAHELAEKIRECNPDRSSDWSDGVDWAADLIDPEA